jgi:hypothetical protein
MLWGVLLAFETEQNVPLSLYVALKSLVISSRSLRWVSIEYALVLTVVPFAVLIFGEQ